jgi:AcrR family transcriptional regulator
MVARDGYSATTMVRIAEEASVSKGSIYRRWPTKGVLVYEACFVRPDDLSDVIDSGDIRADLVAVAELTAAGFRRGRDVALFDEIVTEARSDPQLMELLRTRFFVPRSDAIIRRVEQAIERGELRNGLNPMLVPALVNGAQEYLRGVRGRVLTKAELHDLVEMVIGAFVTAPRQSSS